ncbi:tol-pal system YbgF family protein [Alienimonas sp. DA493]|uniref:tetratricopeptide repeat protein n=1 Tax=Alienimonas sp. DA493 TaxID=3373605 RepID=UPI0037549915
MIALPLPAARRSGSRPAATRFAVIWGAAAFALLAAPAWADSVTPRGEPTIPGTITAGDRSELTIKPATDPAETVPAAEIAEVSWDGEPATMGAARGREGRGDLVGALEVYREAAPKMASIGPLAKADGQFLVARVLGKLALNDPARRAEAVASLQQFVKDYPDHFRTDPALRMLVDVQTAAGELDAAAATLEQLKQSPSEEFQTAAAVAEGQLALKRNEADAALSAFDSVLQNAEGRAAAEAKIGRAAALTRLNRHDEALTVLEGVLDETDASDAELRAAAHVGRGESLQATGETKPAILEYLKVDVLYSGASAAHAESLYHLSRLWATVGLPERAAEAAAKLKTNYPNSDWAGKLSAG